MLATSLHPRRRTLGTINLEPILVAPSRLNPYEVVWNNEPGGNVEHIAEVDE
jgi:hypothetical protein